MTSDSTNRRTKEREDEDCSRRCRSSSCFCGSSCVDEIMFCSLLTLHTVNTVCTTVTDRIRGNWSVRSTQSASQSFSSCSLTTRRRRKTSRRSNGKGLAPMLMMIAGATSSASFEKEYCTVWVKRKTERRKMMMMVTGLGQAGECCAFQSTTFRTLTVSSSVCVLCSEDNSRTHNAQNKTLRKHALLSSVTYTQTQEREKGMEGAKVNTDWKKNFLPHAVHSTHTHCCWYIREKHVFLWGMRRLEGEEGKERTEEERMSSRSLVSLFSVCDSCESQHRDIRTLYRHSGSVNNRNGSLRKLADREGFCGRTFFSFSLLVQSARIPQSEKERKENWEKKKERNYSMFETTKGWRRESKSQKVRLSTISTYLTEEPNFRSSRTKEETRDEMRWAEKIGTLFLSTRKRKNVETTDPFDVPATTERLPDQM